MCSDCGGQKRASHPVEVELQVVVSCLCQGQVYKQRLIIPAIWETEVGGSQVQRLSGLQSEYMASLVNLVKFCLKMKIGKKTKRVGV